MKADTIKLIATYLITAMVLGFGYYSLVIYPYQLDDLVKGAIIGFMGSSIAFVYGDQVATRTQHQQQKAYDSGVQTMPTMTATTDPSTVTVTPTPPANDEDAPTPGPTVGG